MTAHPPPTAAGFASHHGGSRIFALGPLVVIGGAEMTVTSLRTENIRPLFDLRDASHTNDCSGQSSTACNPVYFDGNATTNRQTILQQYFVVSGLWEASIVLYAHMKPRASDKQQKVFSILKPKTGQNTTSPK